MFLVYAPGNTDVVQLEPLAASYNQLEREVNAVVLGGAELIDCSVFLIRPKLECVEMVCESSDPAYGVIN